MPAVLAELPRVVPDFSMINPKNIWLDIPSGSSIDDAINGGSGFSSGKRQFHLEPGGTYDGDINISVGAGISDICEIRPGDVTLPAMGTRVERTTALGFTPPKITAQNSNRGFNFNGARGWRLRCLEIRGAPTAGYDSGNGDMTPLIQTAPDPLSSGYGSLPSHISITQCLVGGDDANHHGTMNRRIGIMGNATMLEIRDSTLFNFNWGGITYVIGQAQSTGAYAGRGKMLIDNCNLWGATESIAWGGASQYPQLEPEQQLVCDLTIRKSHIYRPDSVRGYQGCANGTEWKIGRRVLVEACIIENVYKELQNGMAFGVWSVDQNGINPWVQTSDFTARYCWLKNTAGIFFATAMYSGHPSVPMIRLTMQHNIATGTGVTGAWRSWDADPAVFDVLLQNNLFINNGGEIWMVTNYAPFKRLDILNNIMGTTYGGSAIFFTSSGAGQFAWDKFNENGDCRFTGNHVLQPSGSGVPNPGTNTTHTSLATMGFVNSAYVGSMDTKYADLGNLHNTTGAGPDMTTLESKLAEVEMSAAEYALYAT